MISTAAWPLDQSCTLNVSTASVQEVALHSRPLLGGVVGRDVGALRGVVGRDGPQRPVELVVAGRLRRNVDTEVPVDSSVQGTPVVCLGPATVVIIALAGPSLASRLSFLERRVGCQGGRVSR